MFLKLNENVKNAILVDHHVIGQIGLFMEHTEDEKKTTAREIRKAWKRTDKERRGGDKMKFVFANARMKISTATTTKSLNI